MFKKVLHIYYDKILILEMLNAKVSGIIPSNILGSLMAISITYDHIPNNILTVWFSFHIIIAIFRFFIGSKLEHELKIDGKRVNYFLNSYLLLISLSGLLYGVIALLSVLHGAPDINTIVIASMLIALTAGSLSTLGSVFKVFLSFMLSSTIPLLAIFLYFDGMFFDQFAFIIFTYTVVHLTSGYRLFLTHQRTIKAELDLALLNESLEKRISQELEKNAIQNQQLIEQSRLAQMGEMIAMIAHQWRQPLSAISATSASIGIKAQLQILNNTLALELAKKISDSAQHLSQTIDDFRNFFKNNKEQESSSLKEIVEDTLNIMRDSIINKNITLNTLSLCEEEFKTFPSEIKQVVLNILKNAQDALLEKDISNPIITIDSTCKENRKILTISDNAGGIPDEILLKIFDPYFSTKLEKDGTGLGLYMSKTIIEEHCKGTLSVKNSKDGAIFTIEL